MFIIKDTPENKQPEDKRTEALNRASNLTIVALIASFYWLLKYQIIESFFLILPYYYYLKLKTKSKPALVLKSIGYPLIFAVVFSLYLYSEHARGGFDNSYARLKMLHTIGAILRISIFAMIVTLISQLIKYNKSPKFSLKNLLFWFAVIGVLNGLILFAYIKGFF